MTSAIQALHCNWRLSLRYSRNAFFWGGGGEQVQLSIGSSGMETLAELYRN